MRVDFKNNVKNFLKDIKNNILTISAIIVLLAVISTSAFICKFSFENFCYGFLGNLFSDTIVFILFGFLFIKYYEGRNKPKPLIFANDSSTEIIIKKTAIKNNKYEIQFSIFNASNTILNKDNSYFHILIPKILFSKVINDPTPRITDTQLFYDINTMISVPCLPYRHTDILTVECKLPDFSAFRGLKKINWEILYFISTEFGIFPKKSKLNVDDYKIDLNSVGRIKINFL